MQATYGHLGLGVSCMGLGMSLGIWPWLCLPVSLPHSGQEEEDDTKSVQETRQDPINH